MCPPPSAISSRNPCPKNPPCPVLLPTLLLNNPAPLFPLPAPGIVVVVAAVSSVLAESLLAVVATLPGRGRLCERIVASRSELNILAMPLPPPLLQLSLLLVVVVVPFFFAASANPKGAHCAFSASSSFFLSFF